jgi:RHS repeat-associated protein
MAEGREGIPDAAAANGAARTSGQGSGASPAQPASSITPPKIELPKGGGAIRGIGEKFAANPVTGTGTMTVPIFTSPGRQGFGPQLSLSYDSGSGNGPFGLGWHLSLPTITRKTDKGLPQYRDATESDVFILSGAEDLVPVFRQDIDGHWIAKRPGYARDADHWVHDRTGEFVIHEDDVDGYRVRRYRPRVEGLFARIERWSNLADTTDVSWRSISRDNIVIWYGRDAESRIADSATRRHIYSWLISESRDDRGNAIRYRYKADDGAGVTLSRPCERNRGAANDPARTTQRYLKRILYGNRKPLLAADGERPRVVPSADWAAAQWLFEVVLDYGEHDADAPSSSEAAPWNYRPDPFSSYRSGFEVRTTRLCQRVLMFHHFPDELDVKDDCLVKSTDFAYRFEDQPTDERNPVYSRLLAATQRGYRRTAPGTYLSRALPPVEFEYSEPEIQSTVLDVPAASLENLPVGDARPWQWTDIHGEGTPGLLAEQAGTWFFKRNWSALGDRGVAIGPLQRVGVQPNASIASGQAQFIDLAGDGQPDLVVLDGPIPGFYEHDDDDSWKPFRPFPARLNRLSREPNSRFIDLTGDGHSDLLVTDDEALIWYESLGEDGFAEARKVAWDVDEDRGPRLVFADASQTVFLADMTGDGLTDLVRVRRSETCYYTNLGFGRFGAKVTMDGSPWLDEPDSFDPRRVRLADVDGTGTADLLYLHRDGVRVYFNQSGNGFGKAHNLPVALGVNELVSVATADLLGNGTACLVWSSSGPADAPRPMRYLDLMGGVKPHLLIRTVNNLGAETHVVYAPSTRFYLQDLKAGAPWATRLPFPVHVVERVETWDCISRNRFVTRYAYHEGYYDGVEREFRGFGMVEQWDSEQWATFSASDEFPLGENAEQSSHVPPVRTKTWYHTGVYLGRDQVSRHLADQYFKEPGRSAAELDQQLLADTALPAGLTLEEQREACRALKGLTLRQEVYADDVGPASQYPYLVTESNASVRCLQPAGRGRHAVFLTHPAESLSYHYERNPTDPRVQHALTLEVDEFGSVLKEAAIGYGRRQQIYGVDSHGQWVKGPNAELAQLNTADQGRQTMALATITERRVTNEIDDLDAYRTPVACEVRTFELTGFSVSPATGRLRPGDLVSVAADGSGTVTARFDRELAYEGVPSSELERRLIERQRTLFRGDDFGQLLPLGKLQSRALPGERYQLAFTTALIAAIYQRPISTGGREALLPDPVSVLAGSGGGYVASETLKADGRFPASDADGEWWVPSGRSYFIEDGSATAAAERAEALGHFLVARRFRDAFGAESLIRQDAYDLSIRQSEDALGNQTTVEQQDYRVLQPRRVRDPNGNRTAAAYDALGLVVGTAVMGKAAPAVVEGDSLTGFVEDLSDADVRAQITDPLADPWSVLAGASTRVIHDLSAYWRTRNDPAPKPAVVCALARETHAAELRGSAKTRVQVALSYSDGNGREIQKKVHAEPAREAPVVPRWIGSGWTIFNNKGKPVRQYEPFFTLTPAFEFKRIEGVSPVLFYDPMERVVATLNADHSYQKVVFDPWRRADFDANDTCAARLTETGDPRTDPDIRRVASGYLTRQGPGWQTWAERRGGTGATAEDLLSVSQSAVHAATPTVTLLDALGRPFLVNAHNRMSRDGVVTEGVIATRTALDIEGNTLAVRDGVVQQGDVLGRIVMRYAYDIRGQRVRQESMEAGAQWMLVDAAGKAIRGWDSRGHNTRIRYDALRRPVEQSLRGTTGESDPRALNRDVLIERTEYGETLDASLGAGRAAALNLRGRIYRHFDGAGVVTNAALDGSGVPTRACDFKGNVLASTRQVVVDYQSLPDWGQSPALIGERFVSRTRYDALSRPVQTVTPHSDGAGSTLNVIQPTFNEAGQLTRIDVWLGLSATPSTAIDPQTTVPSDVGVARIDHDAKGQRLRIDYNNGVATFHQYDRETFRLSRLYTRRGAAFAGDADNPAPPPATMAAPDDVSLIQTGGVQNLSYTYDPVGNITAIRDAAQAAVFFRNKKVEASAAYVYDALYRLVEASGREHLGQIGGTPIPHSPNDAPRVAIAWSANDGNALGRYRERYDYDEVGNLLKLLHKGMDPAAAGWRREHAYAATSLIEDGSSGTLVKRSNRLTGSVVGNAGVNAPETFSHDAHGNMTFMPHLGQGGTTQNLFWDGKDQLQKVSLGGGATAFYLYDSTGQRVRKVVERSPGQVQERLYLGATELYRERTASGPVTLERETLHVMDDKQRVAVVERRLLDSAGTDRAPAQQIRYHHGNHLGSAALELDESAGIVSYEEYAPYGSTTYQAVKSGTDVARRYRFTGKERDEESGFYYHGARYYAPWLGRWTSPDPLGVRDDIDVYVAMNDRPLVRIDPDGRAGKPFNYVETVQTTDQGFARIKELGLKAGKEYGLAKDPVSGELQVLAGGSGSVIFGDLIPLGHTHTGSDTSSPPSTADLDLLSERNVPEHRIFGADDGWSTLRYDAKTNSFERVSESMGQTFVEKIVQSADYDPKDTSIAGRVKRWRTLPKAKAPPTNSPRLPAGQPLPASGEGPIKPPAVEPPVTRVPPAPGKLLRAATWTAEAGTKVAKVLGAALTVYGAYNEAKRTAELERKNNRGAINEAAMFASTFVAGVAAGVLDDAFAATETGAAGAPVLTMDSWDRDNAGPFQHLAGEAIRGALDWGNKHGL